MLAGRLASVARGVAKAGSVAGLARSSLWQRECRRWLEVSAGGKTAGFSIQGEAAEGRSSFLDNQSTTPMDPRVLDAMLPLMTWEYGNPHSRSHHFGWEAEDAVEVARASVGALIGADAKEIIWTSGATECNNMSIKGVARFYKGKKKHIITTQTEHKCVLDSCRVLQQEGFDVSDTARHSTLSDLPWPPGPSTPSRETRPVAGHISPGSAEWPGRPRGTEGCDPPGYSAVQCHGCQQRDWRDPANGGNREDLPRKQDFLPLRHCPGALPRIHPHMNSIFPLFSTEA